MELYLLGAREPPDVEGFSTPGHVLASKLWPGLFGRRPDTYWGAELFDHEFLGVAGASTVLLAGLALRRVKEPERWFWLGTALLGVLLALGESSPAGHLLAHVPLISSGRTPSRGILLALLGVSLLAGHGAADWIAGDTRSRRRSAVIAGVVTGALALASAVKLRAWMQALEPPLDRPFESASEAFGDVGAAAILMALLALAATGAALYASARWRKAAVALPCAALLAAVLGAAPPASTASAGFYHHDWLAQLPADALEHRAFVIYERLPNVERAGGRTQRQLCYVDAPWFEAFMEAKGRELPYWLDVGLVVHPPTIAPGGDEFSGPWELGFERRPAVGGARLFGSARYEVPDEEALALLGEGRSLLLFPEHVADAPSPSGTAASGGSASVVPGNDPNRLEVTVRAPQPAWLFLSEKFYPGWTATVDGEPAPIHRANVAFRAVAVPAGEHTVAMEYEPASVRVGLAVSLAALAGVLVALVRGLRARRRGTDDLDLDTLA
jgi:hypothetical protein